MRESTLLSNRKNSTSDPQPEVIATGTSRSREMAQPEYLRPSYDLSQFQLLEALKVIRRTGRRPTITVNGKLYASHDLRKIAALLPDEDLQPHHQASVDVMFAKKQFGYRRTAYNIAERINSWRTEEQKQVALKAGRTSALPVLEPFPFRHRGFSERTIRALMDCSIDAPERLLFMKPADLKKIPGLGKASLDEIMRYRAKFIRRRAD